jgi:hypothetical protein
MQGFLRWIVWLGLTILAGGVFLAAATSAQSSSYSPQTTAEAFVTLVAIPLFGLFLLSCVQFIRACWASWRDWRRSRGHLSKRDRQLAEFYSNMGQHSGGPYR